MLSTETSHTGSKSNNLVLLHPFWITKKYSGISDSALQYWEKVITLIRLWKEQHSAEGWFCGWLDFIFSEMLLEKLV